MQHTDQMSIVYIQEKNKHLLSIPISGVLSSSQKEFSKPGICQNEKFLNLPLLAFLNVCLMFFGSFESILFLRKITYQNTEESSYHLRGCGPKMEAIDQQFQEESIDSQIGKSNNKVPVKLNMTP
jgi:hypothetical protein